MQIVKRSFSSSDEDESSDDELVPWIEANRPLSSSDYINRLFRRNKSMNSPLTSRFIRRSCSLPYDALIEHRSAFLTDKSLVLSGKKDEKHGNEQIIWKLPFYIRLITPLKVLHNHVSLACRDSFHSRMRMFQQKEEEDRKLEIFQDSNFTQEELELLATLKKQKDEQQVSNSFENNQSQPNSKNILSFSMETCSNNNSKLNSEKDEFPNDDDDDNLSEEKCLRNAVNSDESDDGTKLSSSIPHVLSMKEPDSPPLSNSPRIKGHVIFSPRQEQPRKFFPQDNALSPFRSSAASFLSSPTSSPRKVIAVFPRGIAEWPNNATMPQEYEPFHLGDKFECNSPHSVSSINDENATIEMTESRRRHAIPSVDPLRYDPNFKRPTSLYYRHAERRHKLFKKISSKTLPGNLLIKKNQSTPFQLPSLPTRPSTSRGRHPSYLPPRAFSPSLPSLQSPLVQSIVVPRTAGMAAPPSSSRPLIYRNGIGFSRLITRIMQHDATPASEHSRSPTPQKEKIMKSQPISAHEKQDPIKTLPPAKLHRFADPSGHSCCMHLLSATELASNVIQELHPGYLLMAASLLQSPDEETPSKTEIKSFMSSTNTHLPSEPVQSLKNLPPLFRRLKNLSKIKSEFDFKGRKMVSSQSLPLLHSYSYKTERESADRKLHPRLKKRSSSCMPSINHSMPIDSSLAQAKILWLEMRLHARSLAIAAASNNLPGASTPRRGMAPESRRKAKLNEINKNIKENEEIEKTLGRSESCYKTLLNQTSKHNLHLASAPSSLSSNNSNTSLLNDIEELKLFSNKTKPNKPLNSPHQHTMPKPLLLRPSMLSQPKQPSGSISSFIRINPPVNSLPSQRVRHSAWRPEAPPEIRNRNNDPFRSRITCLHTQSVEHRTHGNKTRSGIYMGKNSDATISAQVKSDYQTQKENNYLSTTSSDNQKISDMKPQGIFLKYLKNARMQLEKEFLGIISPNLFERKDETVLSLSDSQVRKEEKQMNLSKDSSVDNYACNESNNSSSVIYSNFSM